MGKVVTAWFATGMAITRGGVRQRGRSVDQASCRTSIEHAPDRYELLRRPCPSCGDLGIRIVYGYPSGPLSAAARRGQVVLGGCTYRDVSHRCPRGHEWHSPDAPR